MVTNEGKVFKALADKSRRQLLDRLHKKNGLTLRQLCEKHDMSRQAVTKHLVLLETANLVASVKRGREKLHYLNPIPINEIYTRWIGKFERGRVAALQNLKQALQRGGRMRKLMLIVLSLIAWSLAAQTISIASSIEKFHINKFDSAGGKNANESQDLFLSRVRLIQQKNQLQFAEDQNSKRGNGSLNISHGPAKDPDLAEQGKEPLITESLTAFSSPVLVQSINAQNYITATAHAVEKQSDILTLNKNASITYDITIDSHADHSLKLSTSQMIKGATPPAGYKFNFNIYVDSARVANVGLSAKNQFVVSGLIDLGNLSKGSHVITLEWTNDLKGKGVNTKVGLKGLELYKMPAPAKQYTIQEVWSADFSVYGQSGALKTQAYSINESGYITGTILPDGSNSYRPFLWYEGAFLPFNYHIFDPWGSIGKYGLASDINDVNQIVGWAAGASSFEPNLGYVSNDGLTTSAIPYFEATNINNAGQIIGYGFGPEFGHETQPNEPVENTPYVWQAGNFTALPLTLGQPKDLNNQGQIIGQNQLRQANGQLVTLQPLAGYANSALSAINDNGVVVGMSFSAADDFHLTKWVNNVPVDLGADPVRPTGLRDISAMNNAGQFVGTLTPDASDPSHTIAYMWDNGHYIDLNQYVDPSLGWHLTAATSINEAGQIVGFGYKTLDNGLLGQSNFYRAFLLSPQ